METEDLHTLERSIWEGLVRAAEQGEAGWRLPVLGTRGDNASCHLRTVVLRRVDPLRRLLVCHTDSRSAKVAQIRRHAEVDWLFYDHLQSLQLRVHTTASVAVSGAEVDREWQLAPLSSRRAYLGEQTPGATSPHPTSNLPPQYSDRLPDESEVQAGRMNFAIVLAEVRRIDWLWLDRGGNRAARFEYDGDAVTAGWLVP